MTIAVVLYVDCAKKVLKSKFITTVNSKPVSGTHFYRYK